MRKFGVILLPLVMIALIGMAQPGQRNIEPEDLAKRQTTQIKEAVNLDQDQEKQVYDLNLETGKKMRTLRDEMQGGGFEGAREKMGEIREEQNKKMKEILSESQWEKYEKYQEERRARWNQGRRNRR